MRHAPVVVAAVMFASYASTAHAQIAASSQARTTSASYDGFVISDSAPGFAPFSSNSTSAGVVSRQTSSLTASTIRSNVGFSFAVSGPRSHDIAMASHCTFEFDLAAATTYSADGQSVGFSGVGTGTVYARLSGPTGIVFVFDGNAPVPLPFSASGTLAAGHYAYVSIAETTGATPQFSVNGQGGIDVTLRVPCAADFNHDAALDFFDYLDFVSAFSSGATGADYNHDGSIDFFDYLDFVGAFAIGC